MTLPARPAGVGTGGTGAAGFRAGTLKVRAIRPAVTASALPAGKTALKRKTSSLRSTYSTSSWSPRTPGVPVNRVPRPIASRTEVRADPCRDA